MGGHEKCVNIELIEMEEGQSFSAYLITGQEALYHYLRMSDSSEELLDQLESMVRRIMG